MNTSAFNMDEFIKKDEPRATETPNEENVEPSHEEMLQHAEDIDVQKAVVESLAADKAEMDVQLNDLREENVRQKEENARQAAEIAELKEKIESVDKISRELAEAKSLLEKKTAEIDALKSEVARKDSELAAQMEKELDLQERNPNALALLDREIEVPDRFPGETRDHVLEVVAEARAKAEAEGRVRKAQVLEAVLLANEPNGELAKRRAELEKVFADNASVINGTVLEYLHNLGISHKNGEEYLLPSEIQKRTY